MRTPAPDSRVVRLRPDVLVVGAGPAGMAAAVDCVKLGLNTLVAEEQDTPGGQLLAGVSGGSNGRFAPRWGAKLIHDFERSGCTVLYCCLVWDAASDGLIYATDNDGVKIIEPARLIVATGAIERPFTFRGWSKAGVLSAGGALNLLRKYAVAPAGPTVLLGSGPLLYRAAAELSRHGASITAILDSGQAGAEPSHPNGPASSARSRGRGGFERRWAGFPRTSVFEGVGDVAAIGGSTVEGVGFSCLGRRWELPASSILTHDGFAPDARLGRLLRAVHHWVPESRMWVPTCDRFGRTSIRHLAMAGDARFIMGGDAARWSGRIAALDAAYEMGRLSRDERRVGMRILAKGLAGAGLRRRGLREHAAASSTEHLGDDDIACRCERVTVGAIRNAARRCSADINSIKSQLRCGMGRVACSPSSSSGTGPS